MEEGFEIMNQKVLVLDKQDYDSKIILFDDQTQSVLKEIESYKTISSFKYVKNLLFIESKDRILIWDLQKMQPKKYIQMHNVEKYRNKNLYDNKEESDLKSNTNSEYDIQTYQNYRKQYIFQVDENEELLGNSQNGPFIWFIKNNQYQDNLMPNQQQKIIDQQQDNEIKLKQFSQYGQFIKDNNYSDDFIYQIIVISFSNFFINVKFSPKDLISAPQQEKKEKKFQNALSSIFKKKSDLSNDSDLSSETHSQWMN
ncbi:hypothetical protein PPERSA_03017 [Pseudocohnilembus persalinus]|uniref:Uncharacterized protein n=1 Tax=Pseudocohnilembus persalinus TaxID=266149 RepID=A0A0V0QEY9_PSEPJ|nr:hypothetical protein PPERSA_03017 [Pseudocohnilembus persalinus]|eukprot:KRX00757.1 hypothetical protein PPERSA_03017 [Pseudocohnilembus persalinus]